MFGRRARSLTLAFALMTALPGVSAVGTTDALAAPPPNNDWEDAFTITLPYFDSVDLTETDIQPFDPVCEPVGHSVWFEYTPAVNEDILIGSQDHVGVYTGASLENLDQVGCAYDPVLTPVSLTGGVMHFFHVYSDSPAPVDPVEVTIVYAPSNDSFADAIPVASLPYDAWSAGDTSLYGSFEFKEPQPSCRESIHTSKWWSVTLAEDTVVEAVASNDFPGGDPSLAVWEGTAIDGLTELACRRASAAESTFTSATATFAAEAGKTYYIQTTSMALTLEETEAEVVRLAGIDRYATAAAISASTFPLPAYPSGGTVVVASGATFADALSGLVVADAIWPLLLVQPTEIPVPIQIELLRLAPDTIIILGGEGAVSASVATGLSAFTGSGGVIRIGGSDRYETSALISQFVSPSTAGTVVLASGADFPDALAAGAKAAAMRESDTAEYAAPLLLTRPDALPTAIRDELVRLDPQTIFVMGGTGAVSDDVLIELIDLLGPTVTITRFFGTDRFDTAAIFSRSLQYPGTPTVFIANGLSFADPLAGGAAAAVADGPILLVRTDSIPQSTKDELARLRPAKIVILGGEGVVSAAVEAQLASYLSGA